ncbi:MAG TPA: hypothetical protein VGG98_05555 [Solirubrobacteraceae bacterium]|jgi:hypothetical protein
MRLIATFLRSLWEFVVGDDWRTALGVVASLAATALLATSDMAAWWIVPIAALALLRSSLLRRVRALSK